MELLVVLLVVAVVFTAVGTVLPSWWLTALPSVLFVALFLIAFATGLLDGEGGWALGIVFVVAVPFVAVATACVALGVTVGKALYRALRNGGSAAAPAPLPPGFVFGPPTLGPGVAAQPPAQPPVAPERPFGA